MRITLKRGVQFVCVLILLHVAVYYWRSHKRAKPRPRKPHRYLASPTGNEGTCSFKRCPAVQKDALNVHVVPHSHIDVGWLKTVDQYYTGEKLSDSNIYYNPKLECVKCTLNSSISELLKNPKRKFIFVEMAYLSRYWSEASNEQREILRRLVKEGRFEIVNGGWIMSDAGISTYNDIIDQHTLGNDFIRDTFGPCAYTKTAWHVDQFGHSREHATILAQMGFDSLFIGRIDFQDHQRRKANQNLEFIWNTSPDNYGKRATLFTHATFDGYYAPPRFVLDDAVHNLFSNSRSGKGNVMSFLQIVQERARAFQTNHLLLPMGSDFGYSNATIWFSNMDSLIDIVNKEQPLSPIKLNFIYSTPSCYTYYVNKANATLKTKSDDFHPYGIEPGVYWTGYFTTRGGFKMHVKRAGQILQSCKQLSIFLDLEGTFNKIDTLRKSMAVMQHHDAITGTQKKHVLNDYNRMLSYGIDQCQSVISMALRKMQSVEESTITFSSSFCHNLNISSCEISEGKEQFLLTVYNPLSWEVEKWIRIPVSSFHLSITAEGNKHIPYQIVNIAQGIIVIPERPTGAKVEAVFKVNLPPMSTSKFLIKPDKGGLKPAFGELPQGLDVVIENEHIVLIFDRTNGILKRLVNKDSKIDIPLVQDFYYYEGTQGGVRSSGAYVFVPESSTTNKVSLNEPVKINIVKGDLVQEVHQRFSPWVSQIVRLYAGAKYVEIQWTVGPIPTEDGIGKEVISLYSTDLKSKSKFYTDSNGRETMERIRDYRETWDYEPIDKISGNYYPVTSRIFIKDERRNVQLTLLPDRPQGGSSLKDGALELMVHRKLLFDDGLGVGEPLDDKGIDQRGIIFTGKHYLVLDTIKKSSEATRHLGLQLHMNPQLLFSKTGEKDLTKISLKKHSFLAESLPSNVQVLSLDYISSNETDHYLLRLEHVFEANQFHELSKPASVSLQRLFNTFEIMSVEETSLGGNFHPVELSRLKWKSEDGLMSSSIGSPDIAVTLTPPFTVILQPMEIRTFRIQVDR